MQPKHETPTTPLAVDKRIGLVPIFAVYLIPLLLVVLLYLCDVPFGRPGVQVYRYSGYVFARGLAVMTPILLLVPAVVVLRRGRAMERLTHRGARVVTILIAVALGVWAHLASPFAAEQHFFNLESPSHEGAFVLEARRIEALGPYLADFPSVLQRTPEELKGTRVLSNPPGMTVMAVGIDRLLNRCPSFKRWLLDAHHTGMAADSIEGTNCAQALVLAWLLSALWIVAAGFIYALAALWFAPLPAAVLTLICVFNPSSVAFSPGKDPAQLLTIAMMTWGWMAGFVQGRRWPAFLGGIALVAGLTIGLVHAWIALIVVVASAWSARSDGDGLRRLLLRGMVPTVGGAAFACLVAWLVWRWNIPKTSIAVAASYERVAGYLGPQPWAWFLAQVPMFALFAGGGIWLLAYGMFRTSLTDSPAGLGLAMVLVTVVVMVLSAFRTALETPRLWLAFVPLLALGMALRMPTFRHSSSGSLRTLLTIAVLQVTTTCLQWCLFDVRESEMRLSTGWMFG